MDRRSLRFLAYRYFNQKLLGWPNEKPSEGGAQGISHHLQDANFKRGYVIVPWRVGVVEQFTHKVLLNLLTM